MVPATANVSVEQGSSIIMSQVPCAVLSRGSSTANEGSRSTYMNRVPVLSDIGGTLLPVQILQIVMSG